MERILLVEDDAQITASLSAFLQSEGFSVETATGETQARQLVEQTLRGCCWWMCSWRRAAASACAPMPGAGGCR